VDKVALLEGGEEPESLVRTLLDLTGRSYSAQVEIPVFQRQKADFKLIVKADFFLKIKDRDAIIDLTGLGPEVISLLEEHQFLVLSLAAEQNPLSIVSRTLGFLGIEHHNGPHSFFATNGDDARNIKLTLPGIIFSDAKGNVILATPLSVPDDIAVFLSKRAYMILPLS
jgi:hypothetical protein